MSHIRSPLKRGFTLVEVIVALSILAVALVGFHQGQSSSVNQTLRAENRAQAVFLAQQKMTEFELDIRKKNFAAFREEEKGEFKEEQFKKFKWNRKLEKITLGCFIPDQSKTDEDQQKPQEGFLSIAEKIFEQSIRKVKITVEWQDGKKIQKESIAQLYVRFEDIKGF